MLKPIKFFVSLTLLFFIAGCANNNTIFENETEENDMYDGPDKAAEFEFNRTKDPATGLVPREKLLLALDQTEASKLDVLGRGITALNWIERGPTSDLPGPSNGNTRANNGFAAGRVRAIMVDSNDVTRKTVFIGGVDGGLWKTTDITTAPANWTLVNDYLSNLAVSAICQDPRPGFTNIMYFCTGESYYNIDAVSGNGVFKSTDGGVTWNNLASTSNFVNGTRILCDYLGNIYLATRGNGLLRSTAASGGAAWTNITPTGLVTDICDLEISTTASAGRLHLVTGIFNSQAYRFTDIPATVGVNTWTAPTTVFPSFANRAEIACKGTTLYALPANGADQVPTVYKSTDGGANWAATGGQPSATWASGQGWYALAVDINPANINECIIGGLDSWKTSNGGTSWTQISTWVGSAAASQYVHADIHKILWYDGGNKLIYGCDGGIHYSSDKGITIRDRNQGLRIKQFYSCAIHPTTTNYFLAGAQDNGVHQFNNAGLSNSVEVTGGDGGYVAIDQNQPQFQFGSYVYNIYRRSTNGGANWSTVNFSSSAGQFINPFDYDNTANIMYCGDVAASYRRWTDPQTGSTSAVVGISNLIGSVTAVSVSPFTANRVYFGTSSGKVMQVDAANTIATASAGTDRSTGLPNGTISCINQGTSDNNLMAVYSNYGINNIWISTNGGTSWVACDGNLPDMPVRWAMFYPGDNTKAIIATETGVWETNLINGAATIWAANISFPSVRTDMLEYRALDGTIAAATHGRGLWTTTIPLVSTPDIQFQTGVDVQTETTVSSTACRGYKDYTYNMTIVNAPTGTATVTLGIVAGGTATQNLDYALLTPTLNFVNGINTPQPFTVRIYDDAGTETAETFTLNYAISGTTNAQAGTSSQTFTFTINDNDAAPIASSSGTFAIGSYNANSNGQAPFESNLQKYRIQALFSKAELNSAGINFAANINSMILRVATKNSTQPFNGFTIAMANTAATNLQTGFISPVFTTVYSNNYSTVGGNNVFNFTTPFAWDGVSNVLVNFCFDNASAGTLADVAEATVAPLGAGVIASTYSSSITGSGCTLPAAFISDARFTATFNASVSGTPISSALGSTKTAYLGPNDDVYFYDASGNIMARVKNLTNFNYGCTQLIIDRAGVSSFQFWNSMSSNYVASKSYKLVTTDSTNSGTVQVTLYYTTAEINGWQTATGNSVANGQMIRANNGTFIPTITSATPFLNNVLVTPSINAIFGTGGYTITNTFYNNKVSLSGFGIGVPCNPTPLIAIWNGAQNNIWSNSANWNCGVVPAPGFDVWVNGGLPNYPFIGGNVSIKSLNANAGATVVIGSGATLTTQ